MTRSVEHHREETERQAQLLRERLAKRAGDEATAEVARRNCADERAMADKIEQNWDRFVELTLVEEGVAARSKPLRRTARPRSLAEC